MRAALTAAVLVIGVKAVACGTSEPSLDTASAFVDSGPAVRSEDPFAEPPTSASVSSPGILSAGPRASAANGVRAIEVLALLSGGDADRLRVDATGSVVAPPDPPGPLGVRTLERDWGLLTFGPLIVRGPLPPEVVDRIVRQNLGRVARCYEHTKPGLGTVELSFTIGMDGAVTAPRAKLFGFKDSPLSDCLVATLKGLSFPNPDRPVVVTQSVSLSKP